MGQYTQYFCDWCKVKAHSRNVIDPGWVIESPRAPSAAKKVLCKGCVDQREAAVAEVQEKRMQLAEDMEEKE